MFFDNIFVEVQLKIESVMLMKRCQWADLEQTPENLKRYHDEEWGRPEYDEQKLFELMCLESYQAGLSWQTVLNKRVAFLKAFHNYQIEAVAAMTEQDLDLLMQNKNLIRHRLKLSATINNAQQIEKLHVQGKNLTDLVWSRVDYHPIDHQVTDLQTISSSNQIAKVLARDLKKLGFKFLGPVTVYSFMQAAGLYNDHEVDCTFH